MKKIRDWGASEWRAVAFVLACMIAGWTLGALVAEWRASVERDAYAQGYAQGMIDGTADGWRGCIEENNLYDRY